MQGAQPALLICVYTFQHVTVRVRERKRRWDQQGAAVARGPQEMSHVLVEGQQARVVVHMLLLHRWACSSLPTAVIILVPKGLCFCDSCPAKGEVLPPV